MYQVLIVDDEAVVVKGLTASIDWESLNLNVALATSDVNEAVTYIEQRPVDLLITDVCMPDMTGLELISYARNRQPAIRSIVISAHDKFSYVKEALKNGAENYLLKPVDKTELTETIIKTIENLNQEELGSLIDVSNRMAFRSNVLDRWTRNSIDEADLAERASFLDIDIDQSCWSVVLIQPQTMNTSLVHALQLVKIMQNLGEQPYTSQYFINGSFTVVGILSNFNAENQEHRSVLLSQLDILRTEAAGRQIEYAVSIGESGGKYTDIPFSFSQASRYLPVAGLLDTPLFCGDFPARGEAEAELTAMIKDGDKSKAIAWIRQQSEQLTALDFRQAQIQALAWIAAIADALDLSEQRQHLPELLSNTKPDFKELRPVQFAAWLCDFTEAVLAQINRQQQLMHPYVLRAVEQIENNFSQDISLKTIAAQFNVSSAYLGQLFKTQTGRYFNDYLTAVRLEQAQKMIAETNLNISEISSKTGFSSQNYFNRLFKRTYGQSPGEYRIKQRSKSGIKSD